MNAYQYPELLNISHTGAKLRGSSLPPQNTTGLLRIGSFHILCRVVWVADQQCGVVFDEPIPNRILKQIQLEGTNCVNIQPAAEQAQQQEGPEEDPSTDAACGVLTSPPLPRRTNRVEIQTEVALRRSGTHPFQVRAFDLSREGCKIEFIEQPALGERVWVKFEGLEGLECSVRWVDGHVGGVHFERPLHQAIFERLTS